MLSETVLQRRTFYCWLEVEDYAAECQLFRSAILSKVRTNVCAGSVFSGWVMRILCAPSGLQISR